MTKHPTTFDPEDTAGPAVHELKTVAQSFRDIWHRRKTAYTHLADRGFRVGDTLRLQEWVAAAGYTGREMDVQVTDIEPLMVGSLFVVMSITEPVKR